MSALADDIVKKLAAKRPAIETTADDVDDVLTRHHVPTTASASTPVPLRVARLTFTGTKVLDPAVHPEVAAEEPDPATGQVHKPFTFSWTPPAGVLGIGSGSNLRGKTTVLNVLTWALTGRRPDMGPDVLAWIQNVEVDWTVGTDTVRVRFDSEAGEPVNGHVELVSPGDDGLVRGLAKFTGPDEFEGVMGSVMMGRLRLAEIPVWTDDREVKHTWPAFSSAMAVRHNQLDPIVGNVTTLGIRMMQAFIGTDWVMANAAATTAFRRLEKKSKDDADKATSASEVAVEALTAAEAEVTALEAKLATFSDNVPDVAATMALATQATDLARQAHALEVDLMNEGATASTLRLQIRASKARDHAALEDAHAVRFFHQMTPTACPRCTAPVEPDQVAAERGHGPCSLCSKPPESAAPTTGGALGDLPNGHEHPDGDEDDEHDVDGDDALDRALAESEVRMGELRSRITQLTSDADAARARHDADQARIAGSADRTRVQLELATATGVVKALTSQRDASVDDVEVSFDQVVLGAVVDVLAKRISDAQETHLANISADIGQLVASFGAPHLTEFALTGGATMNLETNGEATTYGRLTNGEKLRVKIATAIALIRHGHAAGLGRHPGFLVLDSPAAEEMPDEDLATMVGALLDVAGNDQMQILVATRATGPLLELLSEDHRRVVEGDEYLW
ncbi:ATP-binding protein [Aeromicrobium erythreum]|uniref:Uncharacterized protein n=1 Tax=Aeromicrobium erythreum TaxID=2041 RepID=A0A0U4CJS9_9ACTN|nr:ATP-binding protein [Aeromicrobium erythreum]ALX03446.1 hypothetical protein AERYTH_01390 [Aeromicrobium erythreum]